MSTFWKYFRQHPVQRWTLTLSLAAILGVLGAWAAWPVVKNYQILALLGSDDLLERQRGVAWGKAVARSRPGLVRLLERHLDDADDRKFAAIVEVLIRAGRFNPDCRSGEQLDRHAVVNLAAAGRAELRLTWLHQLHLQERDNYHVRRALDLAAGDQDPAVRLAAATLAGRLGDDETLRRLLGDKDPQVRAAAILDAGLAGRSGLAPAGLVEAVVNAFEQARSDPERAAAAEALARLAPKEHARLTGPAAVKAWNDGNEDLLGQLLCSSPGEAARPTVLEALRQSAGGKRPPPAMALVAAGRLGLPEARAVIDRVVDDFIARREELTMGEAVTLAAAVNAARRLKMPPALFTKVIRRLWHPGTSLAMVLAAEAVGELADPAKDADALEVLRQAAGDPRAPVAAAAAGVALFRLAPDQAGECLREVCESETYLAADYVVWHVSRSGKPQARELAASLFAPRVYNKAVRSAGAMLLALLSRGTDRAAQAERDIENRLTGGTLGPERDPFVAGAYRCALMVLHRREFAEEVVILSQSDTFPKRRTLTALLLAGRAEGFDLVLAGRRFDPPGIDSYLSGRLMARVYAAVAPQLPRFDLDAPPAVRYWQCRVLRDYYLIHRRAILAKMGS